MENVITEEALLQAEDTCVRLKNALLCLMLPQKVYRGWEREAYDIEGGVRAGKRCLDELRRLCDALPDFGLLRCKRQVDWARHMCQLVPLYPTVQKEAEAAHRAVNELQFFYLGMYYLLHGISANEVQALCKLPQP